MRLDAHEIASRYAVSRPGFRLVRADEVGLPFFWLTLDSIVQERKPLPAVDEFVLLAIRAGVDDPARIAQFLGIDPRIVQRTLVEQLHGDTIDWVSEASPRRSLRLTSRGAQVAAELATIEPKQAPIFVAFDRMTWQVSNLRREDLFRPRELREAGLQELPWKRGDRPRPAELSIRALDHALIARGFQPADDLGIRSEILSVTGVQRADRLYRAAVLLAFVEESPSAGYPDIQIDVIIDGRRSDAHAQAAMAVGAQLPYDRGARQEQVVGPDVEPQILELREQARARATEARARISMARVHVANAEAAVRSGKDVAAGDDSTSAHAELEQAQRDQASLPVRPLEVWEHPPLLATAIRDARSRLLIISPWIRATVVDQSFVEGLSRALARSVVVHVGYGISQSPNERQRSDARAEIELRTLAQAFPNFTFCLLGDTHAKILLWDDSIVVTSFNWLSFRGDPDRTFRQEEGTFVQDPDYVAKEYLRHSNRIDDACRGQ